jgi:hypothetical protein
MSVVVVADIDGGTQEMYEQVSSQALADGLPEGHQIHIAGPTDTGWRVINVWDSEEAFKKFREEKLIPALEAAGEGDRIEQDIKVQEVHRLITN